MRHPDSVSVDLGGSVTCRPDIRGSEDMVTTGWIMQHDLGYLRESELCASNGENRNGCVGGFDKE